TEGVQQAEGYGRWDVKTFGFRDGSDWSAASVVVNAKETAFTVKPPAGVKLSGAYKLPVPGRHNVLNALAAMAAGTACGIAPEAIRSGLQAVKLTSMRLETTSAANGAVVLNDAFNASPTSVKAM